MKSRIQYLVLLASLCSIQAFDVKATEVQHENISYMVQSEPLGCKVSKASTKKFTLQSKIVLNKNFIPLQYKDKELDLFINRSIELQIKHFMGFFKNTKKNDLNAAMFAYRGQLKKLKVIDTTYMNELVIDSYLPKERGTGITEYTQNALKRALTRADDKAIEVTYAIELMLSDCTPAGFLSKNHVVSLPLDPYLSLWLEKKSQRSPREFGPFKMEASSNCSSYEISLFGNSDVNWFFWSPVDKNTDKECKIESKNALISPEIKNIETVAVTPKLTKSFFQKREFFKYSAIFGEIDTSEMFAPINYSVLKKSINDNFTLCLNSKIVPECLTGWNTVLGAQADKKYHEPGTYSYLVFLKHLNTLVKISSFQFSNDVDPKREIILSIKGQLRDSLTPIELSIYMGRTTLDYGPKATKSYSQFTHEALKEADSIAYVGHAGLGTNLNISELQKLWKRDGLKDLQRGTPLWMGLYNCEGVSYFGFDLDKIFKKKSIKVIETFTSGTISGPEFPLFHLLTINKIFSNEDVRISDIIKIESNSKEFLTETWLTEK